MYYGRRYSKYDFYLSLIIILVIAAYKLITIHPFISIGGAIIFICIAKYLMDMDLKNSIKTVRKIYIAGNNMLKNAHCTVKYTPDEKIIIMDNIPNYQNKKRMLTITKNRNVNKCWSNICRLFDDYSNINNLALLLDVEKSEIVMLDSPPDKQSRQTQKAGIPKEKATPSQQTNQQNKTVQEEKTPETGEHKNITPIDINNAKSEELAELPGINIVMAKKIIEHRDKKGQFKTIDEFIEVSGIKKHFIPKIKSLIVIKEQQLQNEEDNNEEGRIVDF